MYKLIDCKKHILFVFLTCLILNSIGQVSIEEKSLLIDHENLIEAKGVYKSKAIGTKLISISRIHADSISIIDYDFLSKHYNVRTYYNLNSSEVSNAFDFTVINDSILVILNFSRDEVILYNLNRDLKKIDAKIISTSEVPYYNFLKCVNNNLFLIYRSQEFNELKSCKYTFVVSQIDLKVLSNPKVETLLSILDEDCLLYNINSFNKTWDINSEFIYYSNGCSGKIKVFSIVNKIFEDDIEVFLSNDLDKTISEVKNLGIKYKLDPSYKVLSNIDGFYFNKPNIYYIQSTEDNLFVVYNDSCLKNNSKFNLDDDFVKFKSGLDFILFNSKDSNSKIQWSRHNLISQNDDKRMKDLEWNSKELYLIGDNLFGWRSICKDHLAFRNKDCALRVSKYIYH